MIYIYGLICTYLCWVLSRGIIFGRQICLAIGVLSISSIAVFRGDVGTDTLSYEKIVSDIREGNDLEGLEVGFSSLIKVFQLFLVDDRLVVRVLSAVYCLVLLAYIFRANRNEIFYLFMFYLPSFFYANSMNVLRVGLASSFILLFIQYLRKDKPLAMALCFLTAIMFHYSSFFLAFYFWVLFGKKNVGQLIHFLIGFLFIGLLLVYLKLEYFFDKISLYADYESPSIFSGLGLIFPGFILMLGVWNSNLPGSMRVKIICWSLINILFFYSVTIFSYAGLRFLALSFFGLSISIIVAHSNINLKFNLRLCYSFIFAGLFSFLATYNGWLMTFDADGAPFLPYKVFW